MAQRRMFSLKIVSSDAFLEMPSSSRELYFQLGMYADDDGFVSPKKIMRMVGSSEDDLKVLLTKRFLLIFKNGVVVIKHWRIHNLLQGDRYTETDYKEEKATLYLNENGAYTDRETGVKPLQITKPQWQLDRKKGIEINREQIGNKSGTQDRIGKVRLGKDRIDIIPSSPAETGDLNPFKSGYLDKFKVPTKISSSRGLLAQEIYEWSGKKLSFSMLMRLIKLKGEQFTREVWADVKQSDAKDPYKLFMWKLGQTKVELK